MQSTMLRRLRLVDDEEDYVWALVKVVIELSTRAGKAVTFIVKPGTSCQSREFRVIEFSVDHHDPQKGRTLYIQ